MFDKRVTLLVGHFGSGKTEIALNGVLDLAAAGRAVTLADLDVVKPYFRSRAARALLEEAGVELLVPSGENVFADLPIIVPQIRGVLGQADRKVVFDVGGDPTGARVLGSLADVVPVDETDCLVVLNFRRPGTQNAAEAEDMVRRIETVSRLKITGIVSNTHLMDETTAEIVELGLREAQRVARSIGVPVVAVAVPTQALEAVPPAVDCEVLALKRILKPPFALSAPERRAMGPLFVLN